MSVTFAVVTDRDCDPQLQASYSRLIPELTDLSRKENEEELNCYAGQIASDVPGCPYRTYLMSFNSKQHTDRFYLIVDVGLTQEQLMEPSNVVSQTFFRPILHKLAMYNIENLGGASRIATYPLEGGVDQATMQTYFIMTLNNVAKSWRDWLLNQARDFHVKGVEK